MTPELYPARDTTAPRCQHGTGSKISYASRREAELAAWNFLARYDRALRAFPCGCGAWHLSHWASRDWEREETKR